MKDHNNENMPIFKAAKRIACLNAQLARHVELISQEIDADGIEWYSAELVSGLTVRDGELYSGDLPVAEWGDEYYVNQTQGFFYADDYCGWLYFRTDVPGQYVRVHFDM